MTTNLCSRTTYLIGVWKTQFITEISLFFALILTTTYREAVVMIDCQERRDELGEGGGVESERQRNAPCPIQNREMTKETTCHCCWCCCFSFFSIFSIFICFVFTSPRLLSHTIFMWHPFIYFFFFCVDTRKMKMRRYLSRHCVLCFCIEIQKRNASGRTGEV